MKIRTIIIISAFLALVSCGGGYVNPSIRNTVKKNAADNIALGLREYRTGNFNSAKSYYIDALFQSYSIDNTASVIDISQKLSELSLRLTNYSEASNYIFTANNLRIHGDADENIKKYDFIIYLTIGKYYEKAYENTNGYNLALAYYQKAASAALNAPDRAGAYNNIGIAYLKLGAPETASGWFENAKDINQGAQVYDSLGDNYYYLGQSWSDRSDYTKALLNYQLALKYDKIAEKSYSILDDLKKIAAVYLKTGRNQDSAYYYNKAMKTAESLGDALQTGDISNTIISIMKSGR
ncbi:MAG: hypothetical protein ABSG94_08250 [Brevinematales bacterium]|jgi:tetratricopeptide (TPR) repeat protein